MPQTIITSIVLIILVAYMLGVINKLWLRINIRHPFFYRSLHDLDHSFLEENFSFYKSLNKKEQKLFRHRIVTFTQQHDFIGNAGLKVTREMQLLVAGTAIMISFGFDEYLYEIFDKILIYPDNYYSNSSRTRNKGETNPKFGVIVFSWKDFKAGIAVEDDNLHLGIHEFSHALHFSFMFNNTTRSTEFMKGFYQLMEFVDQPIIEEKLKYKGYIREYAFTNQFEFFAVLVEHLFETPKVFKTQLPEVYRMMLNLLKLDEFQFFK